jgi:hypothetical protein
MQMVDLDIRHPNIFLKWKLLIHNQPVLNPTSCSQHTLLIDSHCIDYSFLLRAAQKRPKPQNISLSLDLVNDYYLEKKKKEQEEEEEEKGVNHFSGCLEWNLTNCLQHKLIQKELNVS